MIITFSPSVHRLDKILFLVLGSNVKYASLCAFAKQILMLSLVQTTVERGLNINKEIKKTQPDREKFEVSPTEN